MKKKEVKGRKNEQWEDEIKGMRLIQMNYEKARNWSLNVQGNDTFTLAGTTTCGHVWIH